MVVRNPTICIASIIHTHGHLVVGPPLRLTQVPIRHVENASAPADVRASSAGAVRSRVLERGQGQPGVSSDRAVPLPVAVGGAGAQDAGEGPQCIT